MKIAPKQNNSTIQEESALVRWGLALAPFTMQMMMIIIGGYVVVLFWMLPLLGNAAVEGAGHCGLRGVADDHPHSDRFLSVLAVRPLYPLPAAHEVT